MADALLRVRDIKKTFPGVVALNGVQLEVGRGEVHALLGENGAGKSTTIKILSGAQAPDAGQGTLEFDGQPLDPGDTPLRRQEIGIVTIYQEFNLLPAMSVAENMYLGREPLRNGLIDWGRMFKDAQTIIDGLGLELGPRSAGTFAQRRRAADGRDLQGAHHERQAHHHGRADGGAQWPRGR